MKDEAEQIAAGLSKAQQRAILTARYVDEGCIHGLKCRSYKLADLPKLCRIDGYLTSLGEDVKRALQGQSHAE